MSRQKRFRWIGAPAAVLAAAVLVSSPAAAQQDPPEVETVVLRFVHIPAESFVDTLEQLGRNEAVGKGLEQMPLAVNEDANAVVLIVPPPVADMMRRVAEELDQPNEFLAHQQELEARERAFEDERRRREREWDREQAEFDLEMDRRRLELEKAEASARMRLEAAKPHPAPPPCPPAPPPAPWKPQGRPPHRPEARPPEPHEPHEHEAARRRLEEHLGRLEDEQRELEESLHRHRAEAKEKIKALEGRRHDLKEAFRRRMEEAGDLPPEEHRAREREVRRHIEEMRKHQDRLREEIEKKAHEVRRRIEELEHRKHRLLEEHGGRAGPPNKEREHADYPPRAKDERRKRIERLRRMIEELEGVRGRLREEAERHEGPAREGIERHGERIREKIEALRRRLHDEGEPERPAPARPHRGRPGSRGPEGSPHHPAARTGKATHRLIQHGTASAGPAAVTVEIHAVGPDGEPVVVTGSDGAVDAVTVHSSAGGQVIVSGTNGAVGTVRINGKEVDPAEMEERRRRHRMRRLFTLLCDEALRGEVGLSSGQEQKVAACIERYRKECRRIEDDVRIQFGRGDAEGTDPETLQRERRRETYRAMRDAGPLLDELRQDAVDVLSDEQKERLVELSKERARLRAAVGDLWVLTTGRAAEELGLDWRQKRQVHDAIDHAAQRLAEQRKTVYAKVRDLPAKERGRAMREAWQAFRKRREQSIEETRRRVFDLLTDSQKDKAEKLLAEAGKRGRSKGGISIHHMGRGPDAPPDAGLVV